MRMTFGKYRGRLISDVPTDYLTWVLDEAAGVTVPLRRAIYEELAGRREDADDAEPSEPESSTALVQHPGVLAWKENWRRIIFLAHPDRGGNEELCKLLVGVNESMKEACAS